MMIQSTRRFAAATGSMVAKRKRQECHPTHQFFVLMRRCNDLAPIRRNLMSKSSFYSVCTKQVNTPTTINLIRITASILSSNNHPHFSLSYNFGLPTGRQLSAKTNLTSTSFKTSSLQNVWVNVAKRLVEVPIGSFRLIHWNEAYKCIEQQINVGNVISLEVTFRILDRIWKEEQMVRGANKKYEAIKNSKKVRCCIHPELLGIILNTWKNIISSIPEAPYRNELFDSESYIPETPMDVWNIIQNYAIANVVQCNGITHSVMLQSMGSYYTDPLIALDQAEMLLNQILDFNDEYFADDDYDTFHPNTATINAILQLCNKSEHPEAYKRAEHFLELLNTWNRKYNNQRDNMKPTAYTIATIISTWTKSASGSNALKNGIQPFMAAKRAKELMKEYEKSNSGQSFRNNPFLCSTVCCALAKAGDIKGAQEYLNTVIRLLYDPTNNRYDAMTSDEIQLMFEIKPKESILSYSVATVLDALGRANQLDRMEELIHQVASIYHQNKKKSGALGGLVEPSMVGLDQVCYRTLIHAYAFRGEAEKAEAAVQHMIDFIDIQPDISTWNAVMHAWSKKGSQKSLQKIQSILKRLENNKDKSLQPNVDSYNILLSCMAKGWSGSDPVSNVQRAEHYLLDIMEDNSTSSNVAIPKPDIVSYSTILRAWCKLNRPDRAEELLDRIHINYQAGQSTVSPTTHNYGTVMSGWSVLLRQQQKGKGISQPNGLEQIEKLLEKMKYQHVAFHYTCKPTTFIYNILLDGLSNSKRPDKAKQARMIFQSMIENYKADGDINTKPDTFTLNSVLTVFLRSDCRCLDVITMTNEISDMAKEINVPFNDVVYNTKMAIFAKYELVEQVQNTYDEMTIMLETDGRNENKRTKPSFHAYVTLLQAKAKAGDPDGTSRVLSDIISQYESGDHSFKPTTQTFNAVLDACLRSKSIDSGEKALQGLHLMNKVTSQGRFEVKPDLRSYTAVLACYSYSTNTSLAANRAYGIYEDIKLRNDITPDLRFYSRLINILMKDSDDHSVVSKLTSIINNLQTVPQTIWIEQGHKSCILITRMLHQSNVSGKDSLIDTVVQLGKEHGIPINIT